MRGTGYILNPKNGVRFPNNYVKKSVKNTGMMRQDTLQVVQKAVKHMKIRYGRLPVRKPLCGISSILQHRSRKEKS